MFILEIYTLPRLCEADILNARPYDLSQMVHLLFIYKDQVVPIFRAFLQGPDPPPLQKRPQNTKYR